MIFVIIGAFFSIGTISAKAEDTVCCEKTTSGDSCEFTDRTNCDTAFAITQTTCEQTTYCKPGCCYSGETGQCAKNTPKATCDADGGEWKAVADCNPVEVQQCQVGCCKLPNDCSLTTQTQCNSYVGSGGDLRLQDVFDASITSEASCIDSCRSQELGCCESTSTFGPMADCSDRASFKSGVLCSNPQISTECTKEFVTGCAKYSWQDQDAVYWYDSCGNVENIFGTTYTGSWISKEESCNPNNPNIASTSCGNCDYTLGSKCSDADAAFLGRINDLRVEHMCIDLACYNTDQSNRVTWMNGQSRDSGEAWCEYEGITGGGKDLAGSNQYLRYCINGRESVEECSYGETGRTNVCIQGEIPSSLVGGNGLSGARCVPNDFGSCISCNIEDTTECGLTSEQYNNLNCGGVCDLLDKDEQRDDRLACCQKQQCSQKCCDSNINSCYWNDGASLCAPNVPPAINSTEQCNIGAIGECSEIWVDEGWFGRWNAEKNTECHTGAYAQQMNTFCRSLGDCGAYYNIEGKLGDGNSLKSDGGGAVLTGPVIAEVEHGTPDRNDVRDAESFHIAERFSDVRVANKPLPFNGSVYALLYASSLSFARDVASVNENDDWYRDFRFYATSFGVYAVTTVLAHNLVSLSITGLTAPGALTGGLIGGANAGQAVSAAGGGLWAGVGAWVPILSLGVVLFGLINHFFNKASVATVTYTFSCRPWVPPVGGADCAKCDDYTACDAYKCGNLGQACTLINENFPGNQTCIWQDRNDAVPPVIIPYPLAPKTAVSFTYSPVGGQGAGTLGYEFKDKIPAYTTFQIGIKTNERASCKISKQDIPFEDMQTPFDNGLVTLNHVVDIPSSQGSVEPNSIYTTGGGIYTFYVKCQDVNGNKNRNSYFIKATMDDAPDRTQPVIEEFSVPSGSYIQAGTQQVDVIAYLNEPAPANGGCKYSLNNVPYANMENNLTCTGRSTYLGKYACSTGLTGLRDGVDNTFYLRCRDMNNNINDQSWPATGYVLKGTRGLNISSKGPSGEIFASTITLQATTINGAKMDGSATCKYSLSDFYATDGLAFATTGTNTHSQDLTLASGNYNVKIWCQDIAGNRDRTTITFTTSVDTAGPQLKRVLADSQFLTVILNEDTKCEYSNTDRNFVFGQGTNMPTDDTKEHRATLQKGVYYVQCKDKFNNLGKYTIYT